MNNDNWKSDPEEDLRKLIAKHKAMDSEDSKSKDSVKNTWINLKSVFYASLMKSSHSSKVSITYCFIWRAWQDSNLRPTD